MKRIVLAALAVVLTGGWVGAQEVPDLRASWTRQLAGWSTPLRGEVRVRAGQLEGRWHVPAELGWEPNDGRRRYDGRADRDGQARGPLPVASRGPIAAALAGLDLAAPPATAPDATGAVMRFELRVGERALAGDLGQYPAALPLLLALQNAALWVESAPPPFNCVTIATFDGVPQPYQTPRVEVRVHGPSSPWAGDVVRLEGGVEVKRWKISADDRARIERLYRETRLPLGSHPRDPGSGKTYMLVVWTSPEGQRNNLCRSEASGALAATDDRRAALVRAMLALAPPGETAARDAAGLVGGLAAR